MQYILGEKGEESVGDPRDLYPILSNDKMMVCGYVFGADFGERFLKYLNIESELTKLGDIDLSHAFEILIEQHKEINRLKEIVKKGTQNE